MARIWLGGYRGKFIKWSTIAKDTEFSGKFTGLREGQFGYLTDLETAEGVLTLPVPMVLERQLARVRRGADVVIRYDGMLVNSKTGRDFHAFNVAVEETDAGPEPKRMAAPASVAAEVDADAEVPF